MKMTRTNEYYGIPLVRGEDPHVFTLVISALSSESYPKFAGCQSFVTERKSQFVAAL